MALPAQDSERMGIYSIGKDEEEYNFGKFV